jgi:hypothetical protein
VMMERRKGWSWWSVYSLGCATSFSSLGSKKKRLGCLLSIALSAWRERGCLHIVIVPSCHTFLPSFFSFGLFYLLDVSIVTCFPFRWARHLGCSSYSHHSLSLDDKANGCPEASLIDVIP